jgi:hypothetical protein
LGEPTVAQPQTNSAKPEQLRKQCALDKMPGAAFSLANRITAMTMPMVAATASSHGNAWINHADAAELEGPPSGPARARHHHRTP